MNPLVYVSVRFHFEVSNSQMFGGKGSVGYTATGYGGIQRLDIIDEILVDKQIAIVSEMLHVAKKDVRLISKEEYNQKTEEDSDS